MGDFTIPLILLFLYLLLTPVTSFALKRFDRRREAKLLEKNKGQGKAARMQNAYNPIYPRWKKHIKYANRDSRHVAIALPKIPGVKQKGGAEGEKEGGSNPSTFELPKVKRWMVTWGIYLVGAICWLAAPLTKQYLTLIPAGFAFWVLYIVISLISPKRLLKARAEVENKLATFGKTLLKAEDETDCYTVYQWDEETMLEPVTLTYKVPLTFPPAGGPEQALLKCLTAFVTDSRTYVLDTTEGKTGLNLHKGTLDIRAKPPMPTVAIFKPHFILDECVEPGLFATGFGDSGGMLMPKEPGSEEMVTVMYCNLSGKGVPHAEKYGKDLDSPPGPMVMVVGPTGSGKAESLDDNIKRKRFYVTINGVRYRVKDVPYDPENPTAKLPERV